MAKEKTLFTCTECGGTSPRWLGKCPSCNAWNTLIESVAEAGPGKNRYSGAQFAGLAQAQAVMPLAAIEATDIARTPSGIDELDRVLGGGIVEGGVVLIGGDPGIGKSTLLLQAADNLARDANVLYVSGEESASQIKLRANRLHVQSDMRILCETDVEHALSEAETCKAEILIIDSIQTMFADESSGTPGSVSQVRNATARLTRFAKDTGTVVLIIGHVTKDGNLAGPRILEHIVDTVLYFEGDRHAGMRLLRAIKNRFGSTNEVGVFEMADDGMREVADPSRLFLTGESAPGCAVTCALEGSRPLLAEVQALLTANAYGNPRRTATGVDIGRLSLLLAVLEKRAHLRLSDKDVYVNVVGNLRLDERSADLAIALCVASAMMDVALPAHTAALGEIGLTGELRAPTRPDVRIAECVRLGYDIILVPKTLRKASAGNAKLIPVATIGEAIAYCGKQKLVL